MMRKLVISLLFLIPWIATAQNWKLADTKTYGAGGSWENGKKVRIDRSYRGGTFSFECKVSEGGVGGGSR